ncbi:unnamed protein product [Amoebophrya sp. A120]|nr:unnamed protein product [Amoebophrya sp. A120]|eukprot:GSA120T00005388001.1
MGFTSNGSAGGMEPMSIVNSTDGPTRAQKLAAGCYTVGLVLTTFCISIALLNITKWIYVVYSFKYPLWMTCTHMIASYLMASLMIFGFDMVPVRRRLTFREQVFVVAPFSILGAASIACGNAALVFLYPSFHEMLQNTTPFWTVVCSMIFAGKRYNVAAYFALIPVTFGGSLCAWGEPSKFAIFGLVVSMGAAIFRALRAIVQANIMRGQDPIDSITLLFYAAPFNTLLFLGGSLAIEGSGPWIDIFEVPFSGLLWIASAASCAACYNLFAFLLVGHLGAVGSMVMGNLKTPTIIVSSTIIFGNLITPVQVLGFLVAMTGAYLYNTYGQESQSAAAEKIKYTVPTASTTVGSGSAGEFGLDDEDELTSEFEPTMQKARGRP